MRMTDDLEAILAFLTKLKRPVADLLQEGLSVPELRIRTASLPGKLPEEVTHLYDWHNGTRYQKGDMLDDLHFFPGFYFLPIEKALVHYMSLHDAPGWGREWFPLFANGGGDFYATICGTSEKMSSAIVGYIMGEMTQDIEYESLSSMIKTIRACFERDVFFLSQAGYLEADDALHAKIAREFNPSVELWAT